MSAVHVQKQVDRIITGFALLDQVDQQDGLEMSTLLLLFFWSF